MPQSPQTPVKHRLRVVRRRVMAAVLATFVAAWLAVAALGKGGATGTAATSGSPVTGTSSQGDDGASSAHGGDDAQTDGLGSSQSDGSSGAGAGTGSSQSAGQQGGPITTGQS